MALDGLPEHLKSRRTAEAVMAPSAIVAAGAGASVAILAGIPLLACAAVGGVAYGVVVALRLPRRPKPLKGIDPKSLSQPWAQYVHERAAGAPPLRRRRARGAQRSRSAIVSSRSARGSTPRCRSAGASPATATHSTTACSRSNLKEVSYKLDQIRGSRPESPGAAESYDRTVEAMEAQLASGQRLAQVAQDARRRLEVLDARMDEAVARAVELSLSAGDATELSGLGADVDQLVDDMEALRQGLEEVGNTARGTSL